MAIRTKGSGFTLIELLVVISIIALLIGILLPALGAARSEARTIKCAAHQRGIAQGVGSHQAEQRGRLPWSYLYLEADGSPPAGQMTSPTGQPANDAGGYMHWSVELTRLGAGADAFTCPEMERGGHPPTNPSNGELLGEQVGGAGYSSGYVDRQVKANAFGPNAALMPRNKFHAGISGSPGPRYNRIVSDADITKISDTILAAEFNRNWKAIATGGPGNWLSKSHRPINPFINQGGGGTDEFVVPLAVGGAPAYLAPNKAAFLPKSAIADEATATELIENSSTELNSVGRHHPGGDELGGTANFLYADGHGERKTVAQTVRDREWGDKYYSVTGIDRNVYYQDFD